MPTKEEEKIILDAAMFLAHIANGNIFPYQQKEKCKEKKQKSEDFFFTPLLKLLITLNLSRRDPRICHLR